MGKKKSRRFKDVLIASIASAEARGLEPATLKSYRYQTDTFLLPALGKKRLDRLEPRHFDRVFHRMSEAGLNPSTIHKTKVVAGLALKLAERNGWVTGNVARISETPKRIRPSRIIPTPEELASFLAVAWEKDRDIYDFTRVLAASGMRPGEGVAIMRDDLDWTGTLTIQRAVDVSQGAARIKSTKTGKSRRVALDPETVAIIEKREGPFVFGGESPARTDLMSKRFKRIARPMGYYFTPRGLRHFHATHLIAEGQDLKAVADRLGHSNPTITGAVYIQSVPVNDTRSAEMIAKVLGG